MVTKSQEENEKRDKYTLSTEFPGKDDWMDDFFNLNIEQLLTISYEMEKRIIEGLERDGQEIKCLLNYIPIKKIQRSGRALVVDFGGTNARAAILRINRNQFLFEKPLKHKSLPLKSKVPLERDIYLECLSNLISSLSPPDGIPLGYCFSYPIESMPDGDAKLIRWTKDIFVSDTVGLPVGKMLIEHLKRTDKPVKLSKATVINDTIASLLAGLSASKADINISLVVGTGTNIAAVIEAEKIPKLQTNIIWKGPIPVNLESGNFTPPYLTTWDDEVDALSKNKGEHRFEKAVSGAYLANLLKAVFPNCKINPEEGGKELTKMIMNPNEFDSRHVAVAKQILNRSAKLVSASLAGLIRMLINGQSRTSVNIVVEGGLINNIAAYRETVELTLKSLLIHLRLPDLTIKFMTIEQSNLFGSALATLANE